MKARWISVPAAALMIISAGQALTGASRAAEPLTVEALAKRSGCLDCHRVDKKGVGPSFRDIAARYKGDARARAALIETIKNGGKGNWTDVTSGTPQPPYSALLSDEEIQRLVDWSLSH